MPELPEVETYVRELAPQLHGRRICRAQVNWPRTIATPSVADFTRSIVGQTFQSFDRRGKYMLLGLTQAHTTDTVAAAEPPTGTDTPSRTDTVTGTEKAWTLIVHLRMTGKLLLVPGDFLPDKHTHVVFDLEPVPGGPDRLVFVDTRKFGRIWLTQTPESVLARLGPEPLSADFSPGGLGKKLATRHASIKALLLDQAIVAGVGNIYADEALFRAGIHPTQPGGTLTPSELEKLHAAVCAVLSEGIARQGSSLGGSALQNYVRPSGSPGGFQEEHRVFRRTGQPCFVCQTPVARITLAQRSTHYCPACQPRHD
ncbi:MAG: bifunctional DNA-formamidopyrimidine glycosylase/DNA-(apurinic or apyrimidinic site) lyase [Litorilinea sp.]